jgi:ankyrin repeat protein
MVLRVCNPQLQESSQTLVVKLLLETGKVEANSKDEYGQTPLSLAIGKGHDAIVKLLRKHIN